MKLIYVETRKNYPHFLSLYGSFKDNSYEIDGTDIIFHFENVFIENAIQNDDGSLSEQRVNETDITLEEFDYNTANLIFPEGVNENNFINRLDEVVKLNIKLFGIIAIEKIEKKL